MTALILRPWFRPFVCYVAFLAGLNGIEWAL